MTTIAKRFHLNRYRAPNLSLPGKIVLPRFVEKTKNFYFILNRKRKDLTYSMQQQGRFSLLGLGDIIIPGLVVCFVLRFESQKRTNYLYTNDPLSFVNRLTYFQCSLFGYCIGKKNSLRILHDLLFCFCLQFKAY